MGINKATSIDMSNWENVYKEDLNLYDYFGTEIPNVMPDTPKETALIIVSYTDFEFKLRKNVLACIKKFTEWNNDRDMDVIKKYFIQTVQPHIDKLCFNVVTPFHRETVSIAGKLVDIFNTQVEANTPYYKDWFWISKDVYEHHLHREFMSTLKENDQIAAVKAFINLKQRANDFDTFEKLRDYLKRYLQFDRNTTIYIRNLLGQWYNRHLYDLDPSVNTEIINYLRIDIENALNSDNKYTPDAFDAFMSQTSPREEEIANWAEFFMMSAYDSYKWPYSGGRLQAFIRRFTQRRRDLENKLSRMNTETWTYAVPDVD